MSIVVNWETSPNKSVALLQLLINFFPFFFPLIEIKSVSIVEGEDNSTRNVPLLMEEEEDEEEEEEETEEARE